MVRVRIAPSPTGIPHIGNTRTALFNYLFAKHNNGKFILRIEDTDRARIMPGAEEAIYEILQWLGILWDEKYIQSERLDIYHEHVEKLLKKGVAYKDEGAVRFKIPTDREIAWEDAMGNKKISFKTDIIEDFVILKSDGFPTYHLANVVDDSLMKITHVIRGDEWISSTPKHILLYEAFEVKPPVFAHLPVILGPDKKKLSKRHGAESILDYKDKGYLKETLLNFMALLGWNPGGDKEIMSMDEMIKLFDLKDVNTSSPIFDTDKLKWMNSFYIHKMPLEDFISNIKNKTSNLRDIDEGLIKKIAGLAQTRVKTLKDFEEFFNFFFNKLSVELNEKEKSVAQKLLDKLSTLNNWKSAEILIALKQVMTSEEIRMPVLYKIFTDKEAGLPLPESLEILGKEEVLKRLKND